MGNSHQHAMPHKHSMATTLPPWATSICEGIGQPKMINGLVHCVPHNKSPCDPGYIYEDKQFGHGKMWVCVPKGH